MRAWLCLVVVAACGFDRVPAVAVAQTPADPTLSRLAVDRDHGVIADGSDHVTITVTALDDSGGPLAGRAIALTATGSGAVLTQPTAPTDARGVATGTLSATAVGDIVVGATIDPAGAPVTIAETHEVAFEAGPPATMVFVDQPSNTGAGQPFAPIVSVAIHDADGNVVDTSFVTVALSSAGAGLDGAVLVRAVDGIATFDDVVPDRAGTGLTLVATAGAIATTSAPFDVAAGPASTLVATAGNDQIGTAGSTLAPMVVTATDAFGNPIAGVAIQLVVTRGDGTLGASTATTGANGIVQTALTLGHAGANEVQVSSSDILFGPVVAFDAATVALAAEATFATGASNGLSSGAIASGDLNGDGRADLVVTNFAANTISVLFDITPPGASAPTYAAKVDVAVGTGPGGVALADVNGDGKLDIAVTNFAGGGVSVFLNKTAPGAATPVFATRADFVAGALPQVVAFGDVDDDGRPDLVVASKDSDAVFVLRNTTAPGATAPSFAAGIALPTAVEPVALALADLDGNGFVDVVVATGGATSVTVLQNTTAPGKAPSFAAHVEVPLPAAAFALAAADLDGDGRIDIATVGGDASVTILANATTPGGAAAFAAPVQLPLAAPASGIAIGDITADGLPDLVVTEADASTIGVIASLPADDVTGIARHFVGHVELATVAQPDSVALADVDGDGRADIVVRGDGAALLGARLGRATPGVPLAFTPGPFSGVNASQIDAVAIADFNGDGLVDLAMTTNSSSEATIWFDQGDPFGFNENNQPIGGTDGAAIAIADINRDGRPDVITSNDAADTLSILLDTTLVGSGVPAFAAHAEVATGPTASGVAAGDVNGDGIADLVVADFQGGTVSVLLGQTAAGATTPSFTAHADFSVGVGPTALALRDLNGDGKPDIAVVNDTTNTVSVLLDTTPPGATTPTFSADAEFACDTFAIGLAIADINGDGRPDLAVTNFGTNNVSVLINTTPPGSATPHFAPQVEFPVGNGPFGAAFADLDLDGRPDLVVADGNAGTVSVLLNETAPGAAAPLFSAPIPITVGGAPVSVAASDVDRDGRIDLVVVDVSGNLWRIELNR